MFYHILVALFCIIAETESKLSALDEDLEQYEDLSTFAAEVFTNFSKGYEKNSVILYLEDHETLIRFHEKISRSKLRLTYLSIQLTNYTLSLNDSVGFKPEVTFMFLNRENYFNVEEIIFNLEIFPIWFVRSKFFLIASDVDTNDDSWIEESFQQFWERQARHAAICFWDEKVKLYTFNPFYKQFSIEVDSGTNVARMLNQKIQDMNGHKLRLFNLDMVYQDRIIQTVINNKTTYLGMDGIFFSAAMQYLSASVEIHNLSNDLSSYQVNSVDQDVPLMDFMESLKGMYDFDILCNAIGVLSGEDNLDHVFQYERDDLYILTPKAQQIPRYLYLFLLVPMDVWLACGVSLLVTSGVLWVLRKLAWWTKGKRNVFFDTYKLLLNQSIDESNIKFPERLIIITWLFFCIIFTTLLQSTLVTSFIYPMYYDDIDTIEDLIESGTKIWASSLIIKLIKERRTKNKDFLNLLLTIPKNITLFGFSNEWFEYFIYEQSTGLVVFHEQHLFLKSLPTTRTKYNRMSSALMQYIRAYYVRPDRLVYRELVELMGLLEASGMMRYWQGKNYGVPPHSHVENVTLKGAAQGNEGWEGKEVRLDLEQMQLGVVVLAVGFGVALGVFVLEVVVGKVKEVMKKQRLKRRIRFLK